MIYHLIGLSPYTTKFINLLVSNRDSINLDDHYFIIDTTGNIECNINQLHMIKHKLMKNPWGFISTLNKIKKCDRIIIHQLSNPRLFLYLYLTKRVLNKCIWSVWGGDVYFYLNRSNSFKDNLIEYLRKKIIHNIPLITSTLKGDYDVIKRIYDSNAKHISSFYPSEIDYDLIDSLNAKNVGSYPKKKTPIFLVGNSGAPENNHYQVFNKLTRFNDIAVMAPLAYGSHEYADGVKNLGSDLFGSKFICERGFRSPREYISMLSKIDAAIFASNRPHALGTINILLLLKKKIYIKKGTTHSRFFKDNGVVVHDIEMLDTENIDNILYQSEEEKNNNYILIKEIGSDKNAISAWKNVFNECGLIK